MSIVYTTNRLWTWLHNWIALQQTVKHLMSTIPAGQSAKHGGMWRHLVNACELPWWLAELQCRPLPWWWVPLL